MNLITPPDNAAEAVLCFARAWNTDEAAERLVLLRTCCVEDAEFVQPLGTLHGLEALSASIGVLLRTYPRADVRFGAPDIQPDRVTVGWTTHFNDGVRQALSGEDTIDLDSQFRIVRVVSVEGP